MGARTTQLLKTLREWCEEEKGRQTKVAHILGVPPSAVADWFGSRRQMTGEQALAVQEIVRTVYGKTPEEPVALGSDAEAPADPLQALHAGLEQPDKKNVWIRNLGQYHHVILGGANRDAALKAIVDFVHRTRQAY
jgi:hypothetical protein